MFAGRLVAIFSRLLIQFIEGERGAALIVWTHYLNRHVSHERSSKVRRSWAVSRKTLLANVWQCLWPQWFVNHYLLEFLNLLGDLNFNLPYLGLYLASPVVDPALKFTELSLLLGSSLWVINYAFLNLCGVGRKGIYEFLEKYIQILALLLRLRLSVFHLRHPSFKSTLLFPLLIGFSCLLRYSSKCKLLPNLALERVQVVELHLAVADESAVILISFNFA